MKTIHSFGLIALTALTIAACGETKSEVKEEKAPTVQAVNPGELKIAFYNSDSVNANYSYLKEQEAKMKTKQTKLENDLMSRQRSLQELGERIQTSREKMLVTGAELQQMEQQFMRKQQDAQDFQQTQGAKLQEEVYEMQEALSKKVKEWSKDYCKKYGIDILLMDAVGGQFQFIHERMDVTKSFIDYVNKRQSELDADMGKK